MEQSEVEMKIQKNTVPIIGFSDNCDVGILVIMNFQPTKRRDGRHDTMPGEIGRSLKYNTDPLYFHLLLFL